MLNNNLKPWGMVMVVHLLLKGDKGWQSTNYIFMISPTLEIDVLA